MTHDFRDVPVAHSFWRRLVGLSWIADRTRLRLFIPRCSIIHTAFLRSEIDVVFVDVDGTVLSIVSHARSWRIYAGPSGTRSVLELPRGQASERGIKRGDVVMIG
ncbi:MAG TPA: DUF192 domain-containing protein [Thermoanaerobaculia bacterium]|jgi:uncharacterized membrane protein (UPF0127 family)|nr:DUF192 domain-containing protein [Thermoanaerobaculia bacterium]